MNNINSFNSLFSQLEQTKNINLLVNANLQMNGGDNENHDFIIFCKSVQQNDDKITKINERSVNIITKFGRIWIDQFIILLLMTVNCKLLSKVDNNNAIYV